MSRGLNVLTSLSDFVVPLHYINMKIEVLQKSSANTYRTSLINNTFEVCNSHKSDDGNPRINLLKNNSSSEGLSHDAQRGSTVSQTLFAFAVNIRSTIHPSLSI